MKNQPNSRLFLYEPLINILSFFHRRKCVTRETLVEDTAGEGTSAGTSAEIPTGTDNLSAQTQTETSTVDYVLPGSTISSPEL